MTTTVISPVAVPDSTDESVGTANRLRGLVFRPGVTVHDEGGGIVRLDVAGQAAKRLRGLRSDTVCALIALAGGSRVDWDGLPPETQGQSAALLDHLYDYLAQAVFAGERLLVIVESVAGDRRYDHDPVASTTPVQLSRFTLLRRAHIGLVAESPVGRSRAHLIDPRLGVALTELATPGPVARVAERISAASDVEVSVVRRLLDVLVGAELAEYDLSGRRAAEDEVVGFPSETNPVLRQWEPADLYFHSRSRLGQTDAPFGGKFPFVGDLEPRPIVKPVPSGTRVELPRPDFATVAATDPSLLDVMESRRSVRQYGSTPLNLQQVSEFLYRVDRIRGDFGPRPQAGMPYAASTRPYPCGGGAYELELYLTVRRCAGLEPATYYYDPAGHALIQLPTAAPQREQLLRTASMSAGGTVVPDILITVTSRFQRVSWKYQAIAYAVTLKHVGVLYQTMYLVATAMGLAPCGLGSGDSVAAADAFGLDYLEESSVGEFLLGSLPDVPADGGAPTSPVFNDWRSGLDPEWQQTATRRLLARRAGDDPS